MHLNINGKDIVKHNSPPRSEKHVKSIINAPTSSSKIKGLIDTGFLLIPSLLPLTMSLGNPFQFLT